MSKIVWPKSDVVPVGALVIVCLIESITHFGRIDGDFPDYVNIARYFEGKAPLLYPFRLTRPITPFLATIPNSFGIDIISSFAIVNTAFWVASSLAMYFLTVRSLKLSRSNAFVAALLTATSYPFLNFGAAVLIDSGAYFFEVFGILVWMEFFLSTRGDQRLLIFASIVSGVGILARETVVVVPILAVLYSIMCRKRRGPAVLFLFLSAVIPSAWYIYSGAFGAYASYFVGTLVGTAFVSGRFAQGIIQTYSLALPFAAVGFLDEKNPANLRFHMIQIVSSLAVLLGSLHTLDPRTYFIAYPSIMALASIGVEWFSGKLSSKPYFDKVPKLWYMVIVVVVYVVLGNYVSRHPRQVSVTSCELSGLCRASD